MTPVTTTLALTTVHGDCTTTQLCANANNASKLHKHPAALCSIPHPSTF